jgi:hypothetical protein
MDNLHNLRPIPPALPATIDDWTRKLKSERTLNDVVEEYVRNLVENDEFHALINAVYDEQAVEGSLSADNIVAAQMIRSAAKKSGNADFAGEKLATVSKALNVVLKRYGFSRRDRKNTVGGQVVDGNGNGAE